MAAPGPPAPPAPLRLVVVNGSNAGEEYGLTGKELIIGRDEGSDIKIDDLTVSHNHALLRLRGNKVTIEDLRSLNGTKLNGKVVSKAVAISSGDVIAVGAVKLLIEEPAEGRP